MTLALVLAGYGVIVGTVGSGGLRRAHWPARSPKLGIAAWQALTTSVLLSILLAVISLVRLPLPKDGGDAGAWLNACATALQARSSTGDVATALVGAAIFVAVFARILYYGGTSWLGARRRRATLLQANRLVAGHRAENGIHVVAHDVAAAYCIPGRRGAIVLTSAAVAELDEPQIAAVVAHERAHLRGHHSLILAAAQTLAAALPILPCFPVAARQLAQLVEMQADDAALVGTSRRALATALVKLAAAAHPVETLAAGGDTALARVSRLSTQCSRLGPGVSLIALGGMFAVACLPLLLVLTPAVVAIGGVDLCPFGLPSW